MDDLLQPGNATLEPEPPEVHLVGTHNMLTHFPTDPNCPICQHSKMQRVPHQRAAKRADRYEREPISEFGEITADHAIMGSGEQSRNGDQVALMVMDRFTGWIGAFPARSKSVEELSLIHI